MELQIYGEQFWRPYCHVEDLSRACVLVLESDSKKVDHKVFGMVDTNEDYQKKMLADELLKIFPNGKIKYVHKEDDPRDYWLDFSKIKNELGYKISKNISEGMSEIVNILKYGLLNDPLQFSY